MFSHVRNIIKTRLCQKLIVIVVLSITLISLAVFTPHFIAEHAKHERDIESAAEILIKTMGTSLSYGVPITNAERLFGDHKVVGYQVCNTSGCQIKTGESITGIEANIPTEESIYQADDTRFEVKRLFKNRQGNFSQITLRIDTATLHNKNQISLWTLVIQVLGISFFAICISMFAASYIIIAPVIRLKQQMIKAKKDPTNPTKYVLKVKQKDEIADLIGAFNGMLFDIDNYQTKLSQAKDASDVRWKFAIEGSGDGIWDWNPITDDVFFSPQILRKLGYEDGDTIKTISEWQGLIHPEDKARSKASLDSHMNAETDEFSVNNRIQHRNGSWLWVLSRGMIVTRDAEGNPTRVVGTHTDITEQKENEALIWSQANIDSLTNLSNRRRYSELLNKLLNTSVNQFTLFFIDLDHFKAVNDSRGHKVGDELLIAAALRLRQSVGDAHEVARIGGDEFTVILREIIDKPSINAIANKVLRSLCEPFYIAGNAFYISASIGITSYPEDANNAEALGMNADHALYTSKDNGRNQYTYFSTSMRIDGQQRMNIIAELREAINEEQFEVYYQPIIDFKTGLIVKAEALVRWNHPLRGLVSPGEFIQISEETGMIIDIGDWVFYRVIEQLADWQKRFNTNLEMSINTSPIQYRDNGLDADKWLAFIKEQGVACDSVVVEITESLVLDLSHSITSRLDAFRESGIKIALDDFGTGYSSLSYLKKIKSDYLKIDYSFVKDISSTQQSMDLCHKIIDIAHIYNMGVIVEGVENTSQSDLLTAANADFGQGYLFAKPMPAKDFEALLEEQTFLRPNHSTTLTRLR